MADEDVVFEDTDDVVWQNTTDTEWMKSSSGSSDVWSNLHLTFSMAL